MNREFLFRIRVVYKDENAQSPRTTTRFCYCIADNKQEALKYAEQSVGFVPVKGKSLSMFTSRKKIRR
jgi:hypothetical protein